MQNKSEVFGVKRDTGPQPSMYELLSWSTVSYENKGQTIKHNQPKAATNGAPHFCQHHRKQCGLQSQTQDCYRGFVVEPHNVNQVRQLVQQKQLERAKSQTFSISNNLKPTSKIAKPIKIGVYEGDDDRYRQQIARKNQHQQPDQQQEVQNKHVNKYKRAASSLRKGQKISTSLDPEKDKDTIKRRLDKIKEFKVQSRDLPNSAFVTYFGKPAFEAYGRGNAKNLKTHNIMPHAGDNKPRQQQTYQSALINAPKQQYPHLPRQKEPRASRVLQHEHAQEQSVQHIAIQKPDLLYVDRFMSDEERTLHRQAQISSAASNKPGSGTEANVKRPSSAKQVAPAGLSTTSANQHGSKKQNPAAATSTQLNRPKTGKKPKKRVTEQSDSQETEPLKYLNTRKNGFIEELKNKKARDSRLAYKITQSYPVPLPETSQNLNNPKDYVSIDKKWVDSMVVPAGKKSKPHEPFGLC